MQINLRLMCDNFNKVNKVDHQDYHNVHNEREREIILVAELGGNKLVFKNL